MARRKTGSEPAGMAERRRGFTLIELLVVIAIIAILAAILFPVFLRAKQRAQAAACQSNMKQIGVALQLYLGDWNNCYPDHTTTGLSYTGQVYNDGMGEAWIRHFSHRYRKSTGEAAGIGLTLGKYTKNLAVFKCPSELRTVPPGVFDFGLTYAESSAYYVKHAMCYYANYYKRPLKMSDVTYVTRATMMYEAGWHSDRYPYIWDTAYWASHPHNIPMRVNSIFLDCHVGTIDIPYNAKSAYDGNWYFIGGGGWDLSKGARDR